MKSRLVATVLAAAAAAATSHLAAAGSVGNAITYQGQLQTAGINVDGTVAFQFRLFNAPSGGSQVGSTVSSNENLVDGVFTASLDFGLNPYTSPQPLWLQITADGDILPRQPITAVPYSLSTRGMTVDAQGDIGFGVDTIPGAHFFEVNSPAAQKGIRTFNFPGALTMGVFNGGTTDGVTIRMNDAGSSTFWDLGMQDDNRFQISNGPGLTNTFSITSADPGLAGRVGIGVTNPNSKLHVDTDGENAFRISTSNNATELFNVGADGSVRMADVGHRFGGPNGFGNVLLNLSAENWDFGLNITGGDAGKPGGGSWANTSDVRLKENIHDLDGALDTLLALRGVTYEYKDPEAIGELDGVRTGFIAQEVEEIIPDWVWEAEDGYKRVTIRGFEALTVEAIRELKSENDELRSRLAALESAPATTVLTSSMTWPLVALGGLGVFAAVRRRSAASA